MTCRTRFLILTAGAFALAACNTTIPDDRGVGFTDYSDFEAERQARDAALASGNSLVLPSGADAPVTTVAGADETQGAAAPLAGTELLARRPGISDENDFQAVSNRVSIEDDAARRAAQQQQYQVVAPTALPSRPGGSSLDSIVRYALSTNHSVGQQVYARSGGSPERAARACARYSNPNAAQEAFLSSGGPERDRSGMDPDGDGFVCGWNPAPFRLAVRN
jgi:hypothetical protein